MEKLYSSLSRDYAASLVDFRYGAVSDDFVDSVHLTHEGAARFTRRFEAELLPFLECQPFEELWPIGEVRPTAEVRRRLLAMEASSRVDCKTRTK